jgi:hypothetical protein
MRYAMRCDAIRCDAMRSQVKSCQVNSSQVNSSCKSSQAASRVKRQAMAMANGNGKWQSHINHIKRCSIASFRFAVLLH